MLKTVTRDIALTIQARSGTSAAVLLWLGIGALSALTAFVFLCVASYDWFALQFGPTFAGLIMAGIFIALAVIAAIVCAVVRRRVRQRAILARAARAHGQAWFADPRILATAVEVGRSIGWQRIVPVALFGFIAAQWAREYRDRAQRDF